MIFPCVFAMRWLIWDTWYRKLQCSLGQDKFFKIWKIILPNNLCKEMHHILIYNNKTWKNLDNHQLNAVLCSFHGTQYNHGIIFAVFRKNIALAKIINVLLADRSNVWFFSTHPTVEAQFPRKQTLNTDLCGWEVKEHPGAAPVQECRMQL